MLTIRMQRTGRKGHAMFRVVVQDSRQAPTSGKVVAPLGSYDPHAKVVSLNKEKVAFYLEHGAQPSDRVARLLKSEGVKLPDWVKLAANKERSVKNAEKRRSTAPAKPVEEASVEPATEDAAPDVVETETPAKETAEQPAPDKPAETPAEPVEEAADKPEAETPETTETPEASGDKPAKA
jgi:small subunit ribosomal protein S16